MRTRLALLILAVLHRPLAAQGVTTAALHGKVVAADGAPVALALVRVTNELTGNSWQMTTRGAGTYLFEHLAVGGPYRVDARKLGFAPDAKSGIVLALGQLARADLSLRLAAVEMSPVTVEATGDPILNSSRTGPSELVSASRIATLPNRGRNVQALMLLSPHAASSPEGSVTRSSGITVAGQNTLLNGFMIDGGVNHDVYTGMMPGRETLRRPISVEAIQELQVLVAPFDVRYGGFAGGLSNAVTRSGTNAFHASVFSFLANGALVGRDALGEPADGFTDWQYGGTVSGPVVHDRVHYFVNADLRRRLVPDPGPLVSDTAGGADTLVVGISYNTVRRFQDILATKYGVDPGTVGPATGRVVNADLFGKITIQVGKISHLEVSHHYAGGDQSGFIGRSSQQYNLSSLARRDPTATNTSRMILTSILGDRWSNEIITSHLRLRDECRPDANYAQIRVTERLLLVAGTVGACSGTNLQHTLEITDNLTVSFGPHVVTFGLHGETMRFEDHQVIGAAGLWNFRNLDSLNTGRAFHYERMLRGPAGSGGIQFRARQAGIYVQDRWTPTRGLMLTAGLRADVPLLPDPTASNASLENTLGIATGRLPAGTVLWSPRLGMNYNVADAGRTFLRGGIGLFAGRPPFSWIASAYRGDGSAELFLTCDGAQVPTFDPLDQASTCANRAGATPRYSFFDRNVEFPQHLKVSFGVDQQLAGGVIGTVDILYTDVEKALYFSDANLPFPLGVAQGEGNRSLYGTFNARGVATPARRDPSLGQVIRISNRAGDGSVSITTQLRKRFRERGEVSALYAHTRSRDRMSLSNFQPRPNLEITVLDGILEDRQLRTSHFEIPHRVHVIAVARLPGRVWLSMVYAGSARLPYTWTVAGDANADGIGGGTMTNDAVYVPRDSADIALTNPAAWDAFAKFIESEPCLREQRGRILERNSCRNPWFGTINARVAKSFATRKSQSIEIMADIYNVMNLLNRSWGQSRVTTFNPGQPMLRLRGYDANAGRGVYELQLPRLRQVQDLASRWQVELGVRYTM